MSNDDEQQHYPLPRPEPPQEDPGALYSPGRDWFFGPEISLAFVDAHLAQNLGKVMAGLQHRFGLLAKLRAWQSALDTASSEMAMATSELEMAQAELRRAQALAELGRGRDAVATVERARVLDDNGSLEWDLLVVGALALSTDGRHDEAVAKMDTAVGKWPWGGGTRVHRGDILGRAGRLDEALVDLEVGLFLRPELVEDVERCAGYRRLAADETLGTRFDEALALAQRTVDALERNTQAAPGVAADGSDEDDDNRMDLGEAA